MKIGRTVMKLGIIALGVGFNLYDSINWQQAESSNRTLPPLQAGLYDVTSFVLNGDTLPALPNDSLRWQNLAIEHNNAGSIGAIDTSLKLRYNRSYFTYEPDTASRVIIFKKTAGAEKADYSFYYEQPDSNTFLLRGKKGIDSIIVVLKKSNRKFQLAEKQFHWLSESNR